MEQGHFTERIASMIRGTGAPIPDAVKNKPRLLPGLAFIWIALLTLSSERNNGFGIGRIPWSKAMEYLDRKGLSFSPRERDHFWLLLAGVDSAFVKYHNEKSKKDGASPGGGSSTSSRPKAPRSGSRRR